jgi:hypothetical protein
MAIGTLLSIDGTTVPKLKEYSVSREKLFAEAERNLEGSLKATFIGIFPKLELKFAPTTQAEMSTIISLLDPESIEVTWWDEATDTTKTGDFYAGSYPIPLLLKDRGIYNEFSVNLISYSKLT